ncbi:MAG: hypothetical protein AAFY41_12360 [Bacteroidota bacterium]
MQSQVNTENSPVAEHASAAANIVTQTPDMNIVAIIAAVAAVFAAIAAVVSARASRQQISHLREVSVLEAHSQFQSAIREIQKSLPPEVNEDGWQPTKQEKRIIRMYWYAVFDEWLWTRELCPLYRRLWDEVYRHGVEGGMRNPAF